MQSLRLTISEVGESIFRQFGGRRVPDWKIRRVLDSMEKAESIDVQRIANYRTIDGGDVVKVADELRRLKWLPEAEPASC